MFKKTYNFAKIGWWAALQAGGEEQDDWEEDPGSIGSDPGQEPAVQRAQWAQGSGAKLIKLFFLARNCNLLFKAVIYLSIYQ